MLHYFTSRVRCLARIAWRPGRGKQAMLSTIPEVAHNLQVGGVPTRGRHVATPNANRGLGDADGLYGKFAILYTYVF